MYLGELSGLKIGQATRDAFGDALKELGEQFPTVVTVDGDVGNSTRTEVFAKAHPDRAFNVGIAESNMVSVAGGLASTGHIPVVASFAAFLMCNAYDQIRMSIAFPGMNVKMVGTHAGISIGEDGPSQMGIEDVSLACSLPGVVVMVTADAVSTKAATKAMLEYEGPVYLRLGRPGVSEIYTDSDSFEIGKANTVREGDDVTIIANGLMVAGAIDAATKLAEDGISARVIDMHTIKPLDTDAIAKAARETGAIVVAEEHLAHGGLGSAVSMAVSQIDPVPMAYVNVGDCFAESGDPQGLLDKYGLTADAIVEAVKKVK
ncbi:1-deoxy-D-xylulose-5-phosphate synthase [Gimesia panareensis]|uniref:1-deoxy-D-xylulose-5-phosphate synthase n=1 Tax=Gimesia panareensis TaxID=2527978 RepID=A0A517QEB6_9PLAN|nr:transketolase C-terminal domain-containing protein [Gimesia panareensis]QDT29971.1 1-deoxy-D-xylulose-5-phosphate synthase [Gimesia panareensis]QDV20950.1 1-deoxy-D-xylulose-5-phosphate synthase [Gimesia panareensis]